TSQGAVNAGSYTIVPSGQTSGNYTITYHDGTLTILPVQVSQTTLAEESVWRAMHQQMTGLHPHVPGFDSPGPCLNADGGRATPEACAGMQTSLTRDRTALISIVMP
ncbi:MAG TPA: MBG domain-containing protein, partial [Candidatus Desulfobacillus sp.]|nr:MBG domain-containing protein [Candidatus Desulfobacillus sp.]